MLMKLVLIFLSIRGCLAHREPPVELGVIRPHDASERPQPPHAGITFSSGIPKYDAAYQLALSEIAENHDEKGNFMAGKFWNQVWTRDSSYAISLATGLLDPHASLLSLQKSTAKTSFGTVWLQDECGHFGGWPQLSDSIVGAHGAWSFYLVTGDRKFLSWAHNVTKNTLARAARDVYDEKTHLFKGCASFMESNGAYPSKYANDGWLVGQTKAMSTNMLYYNGYKVAALMGQELGAKKEEIHGFEKKAADLRRAIRSQFWNSKKGYYAYVQDENGQLFDQMEGLGEALALLAPEFESSKSRIDSIFANTYRSDKGIPCLWPPHGHTARDIYQHYHDGRVWPFVQGYWAMAAARHGKLDVFAEEMTNLVKLSQLQNTFAEYYNMDGSFEATHVRQLWSDAGFLSMVHQGLFGMVFEPNALRFSPMKPHGMKQMISLKNVMYRGIELDLYVEGSGTHIQSFKLDGESQVDPVVQADKLSPEGSHTIEISLAPDKKATSTSKSNPYIRGGGQNDDALSVWLTELQKNTDGDNSKACKKMDKNPADNKVDQAEFGAWIDSQPFHARVKTEQLMTTKFAMWQLMKPRGEDFMTIDGCKDNLKKLTDEFSKPRVSES